eukprot:6205005-Pleurochrysis_carterae.AAC.2
MLDIAQSHNVTLVLSLWNGALLRARRPPRLAQFLRALQHESRRRKLQTMEQRRHRHTTAPDPLLPFPPLHVS